MELNSVFFIDNNGNKLPLGRLDSVELTPETDVTDNMVMNRLCGSLTIETHITKKQFCQMAGITNNWLKYHGFPKCRGRYEKN